MHVQNQLAQSSQQQQLLINKLQEQEEQIQLLQVSVRFPPRSCIACTVWYACVCSET